MEFVFLANNNEYCNAENENRTATAENTESVVSKFSSLLRLYINKYSKFHFVARQINFMLLRIRLAVSAADILFDIVLRGIPFFRVRISGIRNERHFCHP